MTSPSQDRLFGSNSSLAVKAPCRVATTAAITLSGEQTVDGVAVVTGDRVLVKDQASGVDNGIYIADTSSWERSPDFDGTRDAVEGTLVKVNNGTVGQGFYYLATTGTITIGTTSLTFSIASSVLAVISAAAQTLLDDTSIAAMLVTLGFSGAARGMSMINGTLVASVASNNLTVAVKTLAGTDPSATDPVLVMFRSATLSEAEYEIVTLTAATSVVALNGSTFSAVNGVAFNLWVLGFNDGGTFRLGLAKSYAGADPLGGLTPLNITSFSEIGLGSSTQIGAASNAGVTVYTHGAAVTSKPYVVLGTFHWDSGLAVAGVWDAGPTYGALYHTGMALPGTVIQRVCTTQVATATGTVVLPVDDTIPQSSEGNGLASVTIAASRPAHLVRISHQATYAHTATVSRLCAALFKGAAASAMYAQLFPKDDNISAICNINLSHTAVINTTTGTEFFINVGSDTAGTLTFLGSAGGRLLGGVMASHTIAEEIAT